MRKGIKFLIISLFCLFFIGEYAAANDVKFRAEIDTNNVMIGDRITLTLELSAEKSLNTIWPTFEDGFDKIVIADKSDIDTVSDEKGFAIRQTLSLTSFDGGRHELPAITAMFGKEGHQDPFPIATEPIFLEFSVPDVDTTAAFKAIKGPRDVPFNLMDYIWYIVGAVLLIMIVVGIIIYMKKRASKQIIEEGDYDPKIPAHVIALEALKQLDNDKVWQKGMVKEYHIRLTDIVRVYIKRRFDIRATEMITEEILGALYSNSFERDLIAAMQIVFETADLAKFAKFQPLPNENSLAMTSALEFVNRTIPTKNEIENTKDDEIKNTEEAEDMKGNDNDE